jgi:hypothetical protein
MTFDFICFLNLLVLIKNFSVITRSHKLL